MPDFYDKLIEYRNDVLLPAMAEYLFYREQFSETEAEQQFPEGAAAHYWAGLILGDIGSLLLKLDTSITEDRFNQIKTTIKDLLMQGPANLRGKPPTTIGMQAAEMCKSVISEVEALNLEQYRGKFTKVQR